MRNVNLGRVLSVLFPGLLTLAGAAGAQAQGFDHLECYKVKDEQAKAQYSADIEALVARSGCVLKVPAMMACVPATKSNVSPTPPATGGSDPAAAFFCYKVKCPKVELPTIAGEDQFGDRTLAPKATKLLCAPVVGLSVPTTTTTMPSGCITSGDCPGDQLCNAGACVPCATSEECSAPLPSGYGPGHICDAGSCYSGDCITDEHCACLGLVCNDHQCSACTDTTDDARCGAGRACIGGACQAGGCHLDGQCEAPNTCFSGQCGCASSGNCSGAVCVGGLCTPCSSSAQCVSELGAGRVCDNGRCVVGECISNGDCGALQICCMNSCVADTTPCPGVCGNGP